MPRKPTTDRPLKWGDGYITERNGRFQARWHDGRAWRAQTCSTRDEAEDLLRAFGRSRRAGTYRDVEALTVADAAAEYLARAASTVKPSTLYGYRQMTEDYILPALGSLRVRQLTTHRVQHWIDGMIRAGAAPTTIQQRVSVLAHIMNECVRLAVIPASPVTLTRKPKPVAAAPNTWSAPEAAAVIAATRTFGPMWEALYTLALTTALRPGELCALRWSDLDVDRRLLAVNRTITRDVEGHAMVGQTTKTSRPRAVALTAEAVNALLRWRASQRIVPIDGPIFIGPRSPLLNSSTWRVYHTRIVAAAGVPRLHLHGMRHTCATLLLKRGVHIKVVSDMLGHLNIATTADVYMHTDVSMQRDAVDALAADLTKTS